MLVEGTNHWSLTAKYFKGWIGIYQVLEEKNTGKGKSACKGMGVMLNIICLLRNFCNYEGEVNLPLYTQTPGAWWFRPTLICIPSKPAYFPSLWVLIPFRFPRWAPHWLKDELHWVLPFCLCVGCLLIFFQNDIFSWLLSEIVRCRLCCRHISSSFILLSQNSYCAPCYTYFIST